MSPQAPEHWEVRAFMAPGGFGSQSGACTNFTRFGMMRVDRTLV